MKKVLLLKKIAGLLTLCMGLFLFMMAFRVNDNKVYSIGDTVEDFSLKNFDGKMVSLSGLSDAKGVIIVFTTNECPFDQAYEKRLISLDQKYRPDGFKLIAINPNNPTISTADNFMAIQARAEQKSFTFPFLFDESGSMRTRFGVIRSPHAFVLDASRKIVYSGAIDDNVEETEKIKNKYVEDVITALKNGKSVLKPMTKPVGCAVKAEF